MQAVPGLMIVLFLSLRPEVSASTLSMGGILSQAEVKKPFTPSLLHPLPAIWQPVRRRHAETNTLCHCWVYNSRQISPTEEVQSPQVLSNISLSRAVLESHDLLENYSMVPHNLLSVSSLPLKQDHIMTLFNQIRRSDDRTYHDKCINT